jgi:hypothetical protein
MAAPMGRTKTAGKRKPVSIIMEALEERLVKGCNFHKRSTIALAVTTEPFTTGLFTPAAL